MNYRKREGLGKKKFLWENLDIGIPLIGNCKFRQEILVHPIYGRNPQCL